MIKVNTEKAAAEIVDVLHENKIPIAFVQVVFERAKEIIDTVTIPANPIAGYNALNERRCNDDI